jgi:Tfp pilus assembly protein PilX
MKRYPTRQQSGFVLLTIMVFMFVAALLALGDMRTLTAQQTLVATLYAAENALAETESALSTMEQFAAYEGAELGEGSSPGVRQRTPTLTNNNASCTSSAVSDTASCAKARCNSFLYAKSSVKGDDNVLGNDAGRYRQVRTGELATECSFCAPPSLGCKARWDETPGTPGSPWAEFHVNFYRTASAVQTKDASWWFSPQTEVHFRKNFYGMVEYVGWAPCNFSDLAPSGTNLDVYDTATAADQSRGCRVMRVTVRNQPPEASAPVITLQSTLLVTSALYLPPYDTDAYLATGPVPLCCYLAPASPTASAISKRAHNAGALVGAIDAERISWRQIFPD